MDWYGLAQFKERLTAIERYLTEIAAHEEQLLTFGFRRALELPAAEEGFAALETFSEDFSSVRRYVIRMDRSLGQELDRLDGDAHLVEQVALILLRLRMTKIRKPLSAGLAVINQIGFYLPYVSRLVKSKGLFGEEPVSLHRTIINVSRLKGIVAHCEELTYGRGLEDDEGFKPSNVSPDRVLDLIDNALKELEHVVTVPPSERARIEAYLQEARREALSPRPTWAKTVGALVIAAAIAGGLADAPAAAQNIKDAIEYILGISVERPLQRFLPPKEPEEDRGPRGTLV